MNMTELIQAYDKLPTMTVSEVLHACFTDIVFYPVFICIFAVIAFVIAVFILIFSEIDEQSEQKEDKFLVKKLIIGGVVALILAFCCTYQLEKNDQEKRADTAWNKEHVTAFFEKEPTKKENVANFTFQGKEDRSAFDRFEKKEGYVFTGFIQNEKGEVKEETFFTETLQYDVKEGETPYIEFKYLPKTINDEAKKGRHQIIFHVDNTILKDILKHTKKE